MQYKNYELIEEQYLKEYDSHSLLLKHQKSGAKVYALLNEDENNLFCLGFKTPSQDNTGVAHILEHTVLAGSKNFPIKDPFLSLLKGSMQTFLNAMTYPDKTLYPAASTVEKDFFNLFKVYADAVFFPLLKNEAFCQEGFRYTFNKEGHLMQNGVVLNEMKGNYSSMENFIYDSIIQSLFPTTPYRYDSGGNPQFIPTLTYENFVKFHETYYHPANCSIFLYGNIDLAKKLAFLDEGYLSKFDEKTISTTIDLEPPFSASQELKISFPVDQTDSKLATVAINWRICELIEKDEVFALEVLTHILLGNSGSPLYMALQNSGLGEDISPISGLGLDYQEAIFSAALREVRPENEAKVENLVLETLSAIVSQGISKEAIEAALRDIEFSRREVRSGPYGLQLLSRLYRYWNYGINPNRALAFDEPMQVLRHKATEPNFFEALIKKHFLANNNRTTVIVKPDTELFKAQALKNAEELAKIEANLSAEEVAAIKKADADLLIYQNSTDDGNIAPMLSRSDIPLTVKPTNFEVTELLGVEFVETARFTKGLYYWDFAFDCSDLSEEELRYLPLFSHILTEMGTNDLSYDQFSHEIALNMANLTVNLDSSSTLKNSQIFTVPKNLFIIGVSAINQHLKALPETMIKVLTAINFEDYKHLKDLFYEFYNQLKNSIAPAGSSFMGIRLAAKESLAGAVEEKWHGISQFLFLNELRQTLSQDESLVKLATIFTALQHKILTKARLKVHITSEQATIASAKDVASTIVAALPEGSAILAPKTSAIALLDASAEGFIIPSQVNFAGMQLKASAYGSKERSAEVLLLHYLNIGPFWEAIRMKGGAYGIALTAGGLDSYINITSYRDPRLGQSYADYQTLIEAITAADLSEKVMLNTLISVIGKEIRPHSPRDSGMLNFKHYLFGIEDEMRQNIRDNTLAVTKDDLIAASERLKAGLSTKRLAAIGFKQAVEACKDLTQQISLPL